MKKDFFIGMFITILLIVFLEIGLRIFWRLKWPQGVPTHDVDRGWVWRKGRHGIFEINSIGYNNNEIVIPKPKDVYRIVCLGDSTTFGYGTTLSGNSYPRHLERLIHNKNKNCEIINAGILSNDSKHILYRLKKEIINFEPNVIILWCGWNDLVETDPQNPHLKEEKFVQNLRNKSYIIRLLMGITYKVILPNMEKINFNLNTKRLVYANFYPVKYEENLREIFKVCQENKIKLVILTLTSSAYFAHSVSEDKVVKFPYFTRNVELLKILLDRYNFVIRNFADKNNLFLIDIQRDFAKMKDPMKYFVSHCHMTNEGYKLVAEIIYKKLVEYGIVR